MNLANAIDLWKRYGRFSQREVFDLIISVLAITFVFWFSALDVKLGTPNDAIESFVKVLFLVGLGFVLHELAHRTLALFYGIQAEYRAWYPGIIVSSIIAFFTGLVFIAPGYVNMKILKAHVDGEKLVVDEVQLEGKKPVSWKQFEEAYLHTD